ncbi:hypothetical protein LCGC14_0142780 [marine sediment metagenome]|uniref:Uncharacterized protein n=1 Tax=marine sediment metagenome TaxID=412755 RepID=A0A0F9Y2W4_9ZZZZ
MAQSSIECVQVIFGLPDWTSDRQFDEEVTERYDGGHAYAGQVKGYRNTNVLSEGLFDLNIPPDIASVEEVYLDMCSSITVSFECDLGELKMYVEQFQNRLEKFLEQKKEGAS